jgi:hypothetical protein
MIYYIAHKHQYIHNNQRLQGLTGWMRANLWPRFTYQPLIAQARRSRDYQERRGRQKLRVATMKRATKWRDKQKQKRWWRRSNGAYYHRQGAITFDFGTLIDEQVSKTVDRYCQCWPPPPDLLGQLHPVAQRVIAKLSQLGTPIGSQVVVGAPNLRVATRADVVVQSSLGKKWIVELKTFCAFTYQQATTTLRHIGGPCSPQRQHQVQALMNEYLYQCTHRLTGNPSQLRAQCEGVLLLVDSSSGRLTLTRLNPTLRQRLHRWLSTHIKRQNPNPV